MVKEAITIPLMAAGGIASGRAMLAAMALGADGVQVGSRFAATVESSAHENFKKKIIETEEGGTLLTMKKLVPVRLIKNKFYEQMQEAENRSASLDEMVQLLGRARAKKGMFEGNLDEGELEIGQVSGYIHDIKPAAQVVEEMVKEFEEAKKELGEVAF